MPSAKDKSHHDYAERVRKRLPRALQELRESRRMSKYALEQKCGISREMLSKIEKGKSNPSFCTVAQVSHRGRKARKARPAT
jgi:transcriptional regulator with XRE-family HTH domain